MEQKKTPKKNYWNLILGAGFFAYGSYRLISLWNGEEISTFRVVMAVAFVILGAYDIYKFYSSMYPK